jgi:carbonic anhydrase/acetyltransferase-like protein (isoleucine patch superfamily)
LPVHNLGPLRATLPAEGTYWLAPDCRLIGDVRLGEGVTIWFGAVLRADSEPITIGPNSNVQDGSVLHVDPGLPLTLGENCSIGHSAIVHGCTVGDGSLIGMGATVLNGAVIGKSCLVGANALVTKGSVFPDRTLILGSPAKAVRELTDDEVAGCLKTAAGYVRNVRRYGETFDR